MNKQVTVDIDLNELASQGYIDNVVSTVVKEVWLNMNEVCIVARFIDSDMDDSHWDQFQLVVGLAIANLLVDRGVNVECSTIEEDIPSPNREAWHDLGTKYEVTVKRVTSTNNTIGG